MNLNPAIVLDPVFHLLDWIIAEWGVYLFLAFVWLSLILIAWIFSGGLRRKTWHQPRITVGVGVVIQPPAPHPTPIIFHEYDSDCDDMD
jgi:hypothetical protein